MTIKLRGPGCPGYDITASYWRAECGRDLEGVLSHYHEEAVLSTPAGRYVGRAEIAQFYSASFDAFPKLSLNIVGGLSHGDHAALEWQAVLTRPDGSEKPLCGVNVVQTNGKVFVEVHTFFDPAGFA